MLPPIAKFELSENYNANELEQWLLSVWKAEGTFERSVQQRREEDAEPFVFLEGPPTANGRPGLHHVLSRAYKDVVCRRETMRGRVVERKAGWDCHGLPVEVAVQKALKLEACEAVEEYGVARFNKACRSQRVHASCMPKHMCDTCQVRAYRTRTARLTCA